MLHTFRDVSWVPIGYNAKLALMGWIDNTQICQKRSYSRTVSRHTFHHHLITTPMVQQHTCLILLKVDQSHLTQTSFSPSDVHECSTGLRVVPSFLDRETVGYNSLHDWLISLAMNLAALCDMWRWKWHQWMSFGCFSEDIGFAHHFVASRLPLTFQPYKRAIGIGYTSKKSI